MPLLTYVEEEEEEDQRSLPLCLRSILSRFPIRRDFALKTLSSLDGALSHRSHIFLGAWQATHGCVVLFRSQIRWGSPNVHFSLELDLFLVNFLWWDDANQMPMVTFAFGTDTPLKRTNACSLINGHRRLAISSCLMA